MNVRVVTEPFSEAMDVVFSAIAESQRSLFLDGVPRLKSQEKRPGRRPRTKQPRCGLTTMHLELS